MKGNFDYLKNFTYFVPGGAQIAVLFLWFLAGGLLGNLVVLVLQAFLPLWVVTEYGTLLAYPIMFIPPMTYALSKSRSASMNTAGVALDSVHTGPFGTPVMLALLLCGTLSTALIVEPVNSLLPDMPEWLEETMKSLTAGNFWINFICVSVFAPFFEEWLCRGMALRGMLAHGTRPAVAIPVSAFLFAAIHLNPWQAVPAFALGLLFGYVYYRTGSLKLTMWMHFVNNTFALIIGHIDSISDIESFRELLGDYFWTAFAASVLLTALLVLALGKIRVRDARGNFEIVPSLFDK